VGEILSVTNPLSTASPSLKARIAGGFYLVTVAAGTVAFLAPKAVAAGAIAGVSYIGVTLLLYSLFKPVSRGLSLLAASFSFAGIASGPIAARLSYGQGFDITMAFFGCYCILVGYLVFRSAYVPPLVGVLLALGGLGYLINGYAKFFLPAFAPRLFPHVLLPGFLAETLLCLWLLIRGVDETRTLARPG
jgi:hypothetical protein